MINYRKYSFAILSLAFMAAGMFMDKMTGAEFTTGLSIVAGVFTIGNGVEYFARRGDG